MPPCLRSHQPTALSRPSRGQVVRKLLHQLTILRSPGSRALRGWDESRDSSVRRQVPFWLKLAWISLFSLNSCPYMQG